jgi:hypothetical protein
LDADYKRLGSLGPKELAAKRREISEATSAIGKALDDKFKPRFKSTLSAAQYRRFQQIVWQWEGSRALTNDVEVIAALKITSEQKKSLTDVDQAVKQKQGEIQRRVFAASGANGPSRDEMRALMSQMQELDNDRDTKSIELLSKKQHEEYVVLKGEPYDFSKIGLPGPTGGTGTSSRKDK